MELSELGVLLGVSVGSRLLRLARLQISGRFGELGRRIKGVCHRSGKVASAAHLLRNGARACSRFGLKPLLLGRTPYIISRLVFQPFKSRDCAAYGMCLSTAPVVESLYRGLPPPPSRA